MLYRFLLRVAIDNSGPIIVLHTSSTSCRKVWQQIRSENKTYVLPQYELSDMLHSGLLYGKFYLLLQL